MNVSCSNGFAPWGIVRQQRWSAAVVFLVIEKNGSQMFLLSLTPLMRPYIVKMTWSRPKMPCPQRILFLFGSYECEDKISHLRQTVGEKTLYRAKTLYHDTFLKKFEHF